MIEIWKQVKEYEGLYEVSTQGRVRSIDRVVKRKDGSVMKYSSKILKPQVDKDGYLYVALNNKGKKKVKIHRLVAITFISNIDKLPVVNHINEIKFDNRVSNLEWVTIKQNNQYNNGYKRRNESKRRSLINGNFKGVNAIVQINIKNGEVIKHWHSATDIQKTLGFNHSNILKCCKGEYKQSYGYKWRFETEKA